MAAKFTKKSCNKLMRELLENQNSLGDIGYPKHIEFLKSIQKTPARWAALEFLAVKGLVSYTVDAGNTLVHIHVEDAGATYFSDRKQRTKERWLDRFWGFVSGVLVTLISQLIASKLLR